MATEDEIRAALVAAGIDPDAPATPPPSTPPAAPPGSSVDYRTASTEDFHAELRRLGLNPRSAA